MAENIKKHRGLGRGLSALMSDIAPVEESNPNTSRRADQYLPIEQVRPNPDQPRRHFDQELLNDLAASVREKGIIQPLIVRRVAGVPNAYEIIAGERRWRAAQIAQLHEVPVLIRDYNDTEVLEIAIIENIQRADLSPIEEAAGYSQLMNKFGHTQEKLAEALGKSRSHIANSMRLLQLPQVVQDYVEQGQLSAGHARALITCDNPVDLAREVIRKGLSVRDTEKLAKKVAGKVAGGSAAAASRKAGAAEKDADTRVLESDLSAGLGMKVTIDHKPGQDAGQIIVKYKSLEQLDELCRLLSAQN